MFQTIYIEQILKNVYQKIGIENIETFKEYLKEKNIRLRVCERQNRN